MIGELVDYIAGVRDTTYAYIPDDVGLVQSIMSAQTTMFQLASFYAQYHAETTMTRYEGGLGKNSSIFNSFTVFYFSDHQLFLTLERLHAN